MFGTHQAEAAPSAATAWQAVAQAVPGTAVINPQSVAGKSLRGLFALCPLYAPGDLQSSTLLPPSTSIAQSRVAGKWAALQCVMQTTAQGIRQQGGDLSLTAVFANRGVLLAAKPTAADRRNLAHHDNLYRAAIQHFCRQAGIRHNYHNYDTLGVPLPQFVDPRAEMPAAMQAAAAHAPHASPAGQLVAALNVSAAANKVPTRLEQNKAARHKLGALANAFGMHTAYWLVDGYLAFDYRIPQLVGSNGIYFSAERFAPLLRIASLTPTVKTMTRVEIQA